MVREGGYKLQRKKQHFSSLRHKIWVETKYKKGKARHTKGYLHGADGSRTEIWE